MSSALYCVEGVLELDEMVRVVLIKWKADAVLGIVFYDCQRATKWKRSQFSKSYPIEVKAVQQVLELVRGQCSSTTTTLMEEKVRSTNARE